MSKVIARNSRKKHRVVIVGGGFGGLAVVDGLAQGFEDPVSKDKAKTPAGSIPEDMEVMIFDSQNRISVAASWPFTWTSRLPSKRNQVIDFPRNELLAARTNGVKLITGEKEATVERLDASKRKIKLRNGLKLRYDTLVLAPGVVSDPTMIEGLAESDAIDTCNQSHVPELRQRLERVMKDAKSGNKRTILVCITKVPYQWPPGPFEYASLIDGLRRRNGVKQNVRILLSCPEAFPFGGITTERLFTKVLKIQGISFLPEHVVTKVENLIGDNRMKQTIVSFKVGQRGRARRIPVDLLVCTLPQRAPLFCKKLCDGSGFIPVNIQTNQVENNLNVYAVGDVCNAVLPGSGTPHPKAGEFAYMMGLHVGELILYGYYGCQDLLDPPPRKGIFVTEFGVNRKGAVIENDLTDVLQNPKNGKPLYKFLPQPKHAFDDRVTWIYEYLERFYGSEVEFSLFDT